MSRLLESMAFGVELPGQSGLYSSVRGNHSFDFAIRLLRDGGTFQDPFPQGQSGRQWRVVPPLDQAGLSSSIVTSQQAENPESLLTQSTRKDYHCGPGNYRCSSSGPGLTPRDRAAGHETCIGGIVSFEHHQLGSSLLAITLQRSENVLVYKWVPTSSRPSGCYPNPNCMARLWPSGIHKPLHHPNSTAGPRRDLGSRSKKALE